MAIEGQDLARLATIVPAEFDPSQFDDYWQLTREFLAVAARDWPEICTRLAAEDEMTARLRRNPAGGGAARAGEHPRPVLVAGSTSSGQCHGGTDARRVIRLEQGAVILPGLDQRLDDESWAMVALRHRACRPAFAHPQAVLSAHWR